MSAFVASLGMYDHPAQQDANDAIWAALACILRSRGVDAPRELDRSRPVEEIWRDPCLLLAQCCGYPLVTDPDLDLRVVAVPVYDVPRCAPGHHFSHIVVRREDSGRRLGDFTGRRAAVNAATSNSGYNLFRAAMAGLGITGRTFDSIVWTGAHRASVEAVRTGKADIAAIDSVSFAALSRFEPEIVAELRIIDATPSSPAPPFVTSRQSNKGMVAILRAALVEVARDPALADARETLFLQDIAPASVHRFVALRGIEQAAIKSGRSMLA